VITESTTLGTSSARGYETVRHGWLIASDPFVSPTDVRGWPRGGSADRPSTLRTLSGEPLRESWDRCADALRAMPEEIRNPVASWVDMDSARTLSALLGREITGAANDAHASALAWLTHHILGPWRLREAMRLHRGWTLRDVNLEPADGFVRSPEECVRAVRAGEGIRIDRYGAAIRFERSGS